MVGLCWNHMNPINQRMCSMVETEKVILEMKKIRKIQDENQDNGNDDTFAGYIISSAIVEIFIPHKVTKETFLLFIHAGIYIVKINYQYVI